MNEPKVSIQVKVRQKNDYSEWDDIPVLASALIEDSDKSGDGYAKFILETSGGVEARWNKVGDSKGHHVRKEGYYPFWQIQIDSQTIGPPMMKSLAEEWLESLQRWIKADKLRKNTRSTIKIVPTEVI